MKGELETTYDTADAYRGKRMSGWRATLRRQALARIAEHATPRESGAPTPRRIGCIAERLHLSITGLTGDNAALPPYTWPWLSSPPDRRGPEAGLFEFAYTDAGQIDPDARLVRIVRLLRGHIFGTACRPRRDMAILGLVTRVRFTLAGR